MKDEKYADIKIDTKGFDVKGPKSVEEQVYLGRNEEYAETIGVTVISGGDKSLEYGDKAVIANETRKEVKEKLDITLTNVFVKQEDINQILTLAQHASINEVDPFSSPSELEKMFKRAQENDLIDGSRMPDFRKSIIVGEKMFFPNGVVMPLEQLGLDATKLTPQEQEDILQAQSPEELQEKIKEQDLDQTRATQSFGATREESTPPTREGNSRGVEMSR